MATVRELLHAGSDLPSPSARRDTEILLCHCLGQSRTWLYTWPEREVSSGIESAFKSLLQQRKTGQPIAYLIGQREFWSLPLSVNETTLIPRPETETLVAWALQLPLPQNAAVLDLGTGSGAIALALASERPAWRVTAVDASEEVLVVARANALRNGLDGVTFVQSDWYAAVHGLRFDALLANPPYIDAEDPHLALGDLRFEPRSALVSPLGGLADLQHIICAAPAHLTHRGWLLLEHGFEQAEAVRAMLSDSGFAQVSTRRDLAGHERITGGCWLAD